MVFIEIEPNSFTYYKQQWVANAVHIKCSNNKRQKSEIVKNYFIWTDDRMTGLIATNKQSIFVQKKKCGFVAFSEG